MKSYRIEYTFKHSKFGFQNSITVKALTLDEALKDAEKQVIETYGEHNRKRFSYKPDVNYCGVVCS